MSSLQKALAQSRRDKTKKAPRTFTPTITTANSSSEDESSSSSDDDSSVDSSEHVQQKDMIKIRQQALDLLNTPSAGPNAAAAQKQQKKKPVYASSYQQQQSAGERTNHHHTPYRSPYSQSMHDPNLHPRARTAEEIGVKEMLVNCVSEVCKSSSSELIQKVFSAGYKSVSNYGDVPVTGTWGDSIDTSQHGYGNGNRNYSNTMPSRYQD